MEFPRSLHNQINKAKYALSLGILRILIAGLSDKNTKLSDGQIVSLFLPNSLWPFNTTINRGLAIGTFINF
ncbi:MAG: hypothetical protein ACI9LX_004768 [Paraglaciecola sp.]|jgi:hypothetical protein